MANDVSVSVKWEPGAKMALMSAPDKMMYAIARQTLDRSLVHIPFKSGKMRQTSMAAGIRGSNGNYYIGSYTDYAKYVWVMPRNTNWSEPGTFGKWYQETYKKFMKNIVSISIKENELK